ncbi:hypothetical protein HNR51_001522, partial [Methylorubrum thiocyanatum]|nr:hypothetical protein [Methylorubrum thiocyanatum]
MSPIYRHVCGWSLLSVAAALPLAMPGPAQAQEAPTRLDEIAV